MKILEQISNQTIERYTSRYNKLGYDVKTLGWGTIEQQEYRFEQTLDNNIDFNDKTVLDIGCGFGDYYKFLKENNININNYIGYDINPDFIREASNLHNKKITTFKVKNILTTDEKAVADIGVMFGVLNFNFHNSMDNLEYSKNFIKNSFGLVKEVLIIDFLSTKLTPDYPKEDLVYYHDPLLILEFAFTLSNNVIIKHNYAPIPQKEFMLYIYKNTL